MLHLFILENKVVMPIRLAGSAVQGIKRELRLVEAVWSSDLEAWIHSTGRKPAHSKPRSHWRDYISQFSRRSWTAMLGRGMLGIPCLACCQGDLLLDKCIYIH